MVVAPATCDADRAFAAAVMAASEPWITLGRTPDACAAAVAPAADSELLIARAGGGGPVGFLLARPRGMASAPYVALLAVAPSARRAGVGGALLAAFEARYAPPARFLFICVSSFNGGARRLYERCGYKQVGELPDYIIRGASELILCKRLVP